MRVSVVTGGLLMGGSTTFLCNLVGELVRRKIPAEVLSFEQENPLGSDFERLKIPVFCPDERLIFEDRLLAILASLSRSKPTAVLANLSPVSFEALRYLPKSVLRVGIAHSDDPLVYEAIRPYAGCLDVMAAVSETIQSKLSAMAELAHVPVRYLPYGVPMPEAASARQSSALWPWPPSWRLMFRVKWHRQPTEAGAFVSGDPDGARIRRDPFSLDDCG